MNLSLTVTWMSNIKLTQIVYALRSEPVRATFISVNMNTQALPMVNAACALGGHKSSAYILISIPKADQIKMARNKMQHLFFLIIP